MQLSELIELVVETIEEKYPHIPPRGKRALLEVLLCRISTTSSSSIDRLYINYGITGEEKEKEKRRREEGNPLQ
jgi:hypothetical protein